MGINIEKFINFKQMIKPYQEGGTRENPVKRTLETIVNHLIYANKIEPEIVGAGLLKVFYKIAAEGLEFKGDGTYGSKGREMFSCIKTQCIDIAKQQKSEAVKNIVFNLLAEKSLCTHSQCKKRSTTLKIKTRWNRFIEFMLRPRGLWRP